MNAAVKPCHQFTIVSVPNSSLERRVALALLYTVKESEQNIRHISEIKLPPDSCLPTATSGQGDKDELCKYRKILSFFILRSPASASPCFHFCPFQRSLCTVHVLQINIVFHRNGRIQWKT
jgi:hypothetical protein